MTKQYCNGKGDCRIVEGRNETEICDILVNEGDVDQCVKAYMDVYTVLEALC